MRFTTSMYPDLPLTRGPNGVFIAHAARVHIDGVAAFPAGVVGVPYQTAPGSRFGLIYDAPMLADQVQTSRVVEL